jgi:hypothetical protein
MHPCRCPKRIGVLEYYIINTRRHGSWINPPLSFVEKSGSSVQGICGKIYVLRSMTAAMGVLFGHKKPRALIR